MRTVIQLLISDLKAGGTGALQPLTQKQIHPGLTSKNLALVKGDSPAYREDRLPALPAQLA